MPEIIQTDFVDGESIAGGRNLDKGIIRLAVPRHLTKRRIYGFMLVKTSQAGPYQMLATVALKNNGTIVGTLPMASADLKLSGGFQESQPSLLTGDTTSASVSPDSLLFYIKNYDNWAYTSKAVLLPFYITAECDEISLSVDKLIGQYVTDYRCYLAVFSSSPNQ